MSGVAPHCRVVSLAADGGPCVLDAKRIDALKTALALDPEAPDPPRFLVIRGRPGDFCSGLALEDFADLPRTLCALRSFSECLRAIKRSPMVVIAVVEGPALGGGFGLSAAADIVLATEQARFALPEALVGLIPGVVFPYIADRVGPGRALALAVGAPPIAAEAAMHLGLVDQLCVGDADVALRSLSKRLSRMESGAIAMMKRLVDEHFASSARYEADAIASFEQLAVRDVTRKRVRALVEGEAPWMG